MKKSAKIVFIILIAITILLLTFSIALIFFKNKIIYLFSNSNYIPAATGVRKDSYVIEIPDVNLLSKYQDEGQDMLVICMASWCHFCQEEAEDLNKFINNNPTKKIIVVSHDETKDDIESFLINHNYNWFVIFDPDTLIRTSLDSESTGIPAAYLLDSNSNILNSHVGKLDYDGIKDLYNYENKDENE